MFEQSRGVWEEAPNFAPITSRLVHQVRELLFEDGRRFLGEEARPLRISVQSKASVIIATLTFDRGCRRIVAKPVSVAEGRLDAAQFHGIHERVRACGEEFQGMLPKYYGPASDRRWILMEYIEGPTLQRLLMQAVGSPKSNGSAGTSALEETARKLMAFQGLRAEEVGVEEVPRPNRSFLEDFEVAWKDRSIRRFLPAEFRNPHSFYDRLPVSFFERRGDRLLMQDIQPKNILVTASGAPYFIDISYGVGNPAIGLSQFLCALDRLRSRSPLLLSMSRVAALKTIFLDAYQRRPGGLSDCQDLIFFYPYVLLYSLRRHSADRALFRPYLRWIYGQALFEFLTNLSRFSDSKVEAVDLFRSAGLEECGNHRDRSQCTTAAPFGAHGSLRRVMKGMRVSLLSEADHPSGSVQPITTGVPFPKGTLRGVENLVLLDQDGHPVALQAQALARWSDGSIRWLLLDFIAGRLVQGTNHWCLDEGLDDGELDAGATGGLRVRSAGGRLEVDTGVAQFEIESGVSGLLSRVRIAGEELIEAGAARTAFTDIHGRTRGVRFGDVVVESRGPVRVTARFEGSLDGPSATACRVTCRLCFFAGTGLVRVRMTLHNPRRARHRGGLWDLGDPGSILFRDFSWELTLGDSSDLPATWVAEIDQHPCSTTGGYLEIYQDSSGGENWTSRNHVNRNGRVPCLFRGYRVQGRDVEDRGLRASPMISVGDVSIAVPEFWQQFPKALEVTGPRLRVGLFPGEFDDPFELQGGERKTHEFWLNFGRAESPEQPLAPLAWVHRRAHVCCSPGWYAESGAIAHLVPAGQDARSPLDAQVREAVEGPSSYFVRREVIDEYGWRNFGEIHADHEAAYYSGPTPVVSHYNNQYDWIYGATLQFLRSGDARWFDLLDPLARHVMDIDIYHTDQDRAVYNGGLFWFTDHYKDAATCTHRTYSRKNGMPGNLSYGGGPSSNHNFTTGLLHYYYLTGDPAAQDAVIGLADWVIRLDDGRRTILGSIDSGPTGLASCTGHLSYQGPGRGCGNSVNALLDAWLVSDRSSYLEKAEVLIRRSIHPDDDVAAHDLLNVEKRWSYTVFLAALARYVDVKAEAGQLDRMHAYARASLLAYTSWMLENERPYFDRPEALEYPTETWAAQELRKANVLRLAAAHTDEPLRSELIRRGAAFSDRAWSDLLGFESRGTARALALVMVEGTIDASLRGQPPPPAPRPVRQFDFGPPESFVPQKLRVANRFRILHHLAREKK